jgi:hypothetical protein
MTTTQRNTTPLTREGSRPRDPLFSKPSVLFDRAFKWIDGSRRIHGARGRAPSPRSSMNRTGQTKGFITPRTRK